MICYKCRQYHPEALHTEEELPEHWEEEELEQIDEELSVQIEEDELEQKKKPTTLSPRLK